MASFCAKLGWKRPRKSENKGYHFVSFRSVPIRHVIEKSKKISNKIKKIKKYHLGFILSQNRTVKDEKDRK